MNKPRKRRTARKTGLFSKKNTLFIAAGVLAAGIGTYLLAGDKIKGLLKRTNTNAGTFTKRRWRRRRRWNQTNNTRTGRLRYYKKIAQRQPGRRSEAFTVCN
jgi:hypothetical protein